MKDWTGCQINSRTRSRINEIQEKREGKEVLFAPEDDDVTKSPLHPTTIYTIIDINSREDSV